MAIDTILINVSDVTRSVEFYSRFFGAAIVGEATDDHATLDVVTATIELVRLDSAQPSTWRTDDVQKGFRHVGFKVAQVDPLVEELKNAGVPFHLDPLDAEGGVRITFFFDPDGTLLELVEGDLQYHAVADKDGVAAERALGIPLRPRFDHVAVTVEDFDATRDFYAPFGFGHLGTINQAWDPRGFRIDYLKGGDTVLEVFTYQIEKEYRRPQLDAPGFVHALLAGTSVPTGADPIGRALDGRAVDADTDGFAFSIGA